MTEAKLREQIEDKLVALCPFVDECTRQCTPADQANCWGVHTDQILTLIKQAGYVQVEPVQLEVLGDEEIPTLLLDKYYRECADEDGSMGKYKLRVDIPSVKEGSQSTNAHNEAKFGQLYRIKE